MRLAVTSIQRNRNPWIVEWLAFHMLVGFNRFFIYCHKTDDGMRETLVQLARHYPITVYALDSDDKPQLAAYQHAWNAHNADIDWMAFIDGDEFLFPTAHAGMAETLAEYENHPLSALGVYWVCYGSSGHATEPEGLVMENYPRHSDAAFGPNRHIKSIVRGGQPVHCVGSHIFATPNGTYDELLRPMTTPMLNDPGLAPSYGKFRINHYVTQSLEYFKTVKQGIGAADRDPAMVRPDAWFTGHDRNECDDGVSARFLEGLRRKVDELRSAMRPQSGPAA
ncbi:glycosyltransferase family 92 protein [Pseudoduganella namucuonensis]|uniref:Glycosyl transferase family 2 n=1 Tax=Pseudoduganella namucuonensis TaxID=1035707 RepID=A0A1I7LJC2_9BURK|nr:glycosyltransferase family 92 protein [Pseudoduganella namucuonensis]SFV09794.1 Glycosyl transferase family 2 [Pseudoduganella namucuonensis]